MSVEPGVIDANILTYAINADAPQHASSRALLEAARDPSITLYTSRRRSFASFIRSSPIRNGLPRRPRQRKPYGLFWRCWLCRACVCCQHLSRPSRDCWNCCSVIQSLAATCSICRSWRPCRPITFSASTHSTPGTSRCSPNSRL